jgi:PRC-barrel domain
MWAYPEELGRLDITGFDVEAKDGSIGKVDEVTYDAGESYVVVDTGVWIFGKKVLLPSGLIERVDRDDETVYVDRTKDEIKEAPEFDNESYRSADYRSAVGGHYGSREATSEREAEEEERVADRS